MAKILGLPFDDYVKNQIEVRQKKLAKTQKSSEDLVVFNSNTSWVRLSSGVKIEADRAKTLSDKLGIGTSLIQGNALARNLVLWGGISSFTPGKESATLDSLKGGVGYGLNNAYGFLSNSSQGLQPPPGIESISCNYKNNGSLKQAQVKLKCFTRSQFEALEAVYLRLGYTMILEWGNTIYFDNNETFSQITKYSIPNLLFNSEGDVDPATLSSQIQNNKTKTGGNYEGMVAKVSNYSWNLQEDLSYSITIDLISVGDIIDSLKANIGGVSSPLPSSVNVEFSGSVSNIAAIQMTRNASKLNAFFYELYDKVFKTAIPNSEISDATKEKIEEVDQTVEFINDPAFKEAQSKYENALKEFEKYYTLFYRGAELYTKVNQNKFTQEELTEYQNIKNTLWSWVNDRNKIPEYEQRMWELNFPEEKSNGADNYKNCLDKIKNSVAPPSEQSINADIVLFLKNSKKSPKENIVEALKTGYLGGKTDGIAIEGSEYNDNNNVFDLYFTDIVENIFGIDG